MTPLELTLTLRPEFLRMAGEGTRINIIERLKATVPSVRYVSGNVHYSVTVSVDASQETVLRRSIQDLCTIASRTFVEPFGSARALASKP